MILIGFALHSIPYPSLVIAKKLLSIRLFEMPNICKFAELRTQIFMVFRLMEIYAAKRNALAA